MRRIARLRRVDRGLQPRGGGGVATPVRRCGPDVERHRERLHAVEGLGVVCCLGCCVYAYRSPRARAAKISAKRTARRNRRISSMLGLDYLSREKKPPGVELKDGEAFLALADNKLQMAGQI